MSVCKSKVASAFPENWSGLIPGVGFGTSINRWRPNRGGTACLPQPVKQHGFGLEPRRIIRCQYWERSLDQSARSNPCAARRRGRSLTCTMAVTRDETAHAGCQTLRRSLFRRSLRWSQEDISGETSQGLLFSCQPFSLILTRSGEVLGGGRATSRKSSAGQDDLDVACLQVSFPIPRIKVRLSRD
jgi:hypothetical protein